MPFSSSQVGQTEVYRRHIANGGVSKLILIFAENQLYCQLCRTMDVPGFPLET